ncbi:MAG TPA: cyclic nucleotide-binding domain-containing protein [Rhodothermales bacterium]|nr:cyclic nucleotide-binding domain-containing protein [Rhodothermales bacterium]
MSVLRNLASSLYAGYRRTFRREEDAQTRAVIAVLKQVPMFKGLSGSHLRELAEIVHTRTYRREEFLYYEGDPGLGLYVIREGRVKLITEDEAGNAHELRTLVEYEVFGELSLFGDFRRTATAQAATETHVLGFFRPDLNALVKRSPQTAAAILMGLAHYLSARQIELTQLAALRDGKVAAATYLHGSLLKAEYVGSSSLPG